MSAKTRGYFAKNVDGCPHYKQKKFATERDEGHPQRLWLCREYPQTQSLGASLKKKMVCGTRPHRLGGLRRVFAKAKTLRRIPIETTGCAKRL